MHYVHFILFIYFKGYYFLAFQPEENSWHSVFVLLITPRLITALPVFNRGPAPIPEDARLLAGLVSSPRSYILIGRGRSWMKHRTKRAAGSRRGRLDGRVGCAAPPTHRLSVEQRRLALSRSSASVGGWGWCCFAAPGRKNAWERKKVRTQQGTAWGGGECARTAAPLFRCHFHLTCVFILKQCFKVSS